MRLDHLLSKEDESEGRSEPGGAEVRSGKSDRRSDSEGGKLEDVV